MTDFRDAIERDTSRLREAETDELLDWDLDSLGWPNIIISQFIEFLATYLWKCGRREIKAAEIPSIIRSYLPSVPEVFVDFFDYAIRTCSLLTRPQDDMYEFIDSSILEYFAVRKFRDDIRLPRYDWDQAGTRNGKPVMRLPLE